MSFLTFVRLVLYLPWHKNVCISKTIRSATPNPSTYVHDITHYYEKKNYTNRPDGGATTANFSSLVHNFGTVSWRIKITLLLGSLDLNASTHIGHAHFCLLDLPPFWILSKTYFCYLLLERWQKRAQTFSGSSLDSPDLTIWNSCRYIKPCWNDKCLKFCPDTKLARTDTCSHPHINTPTDTHTHRHTHTQNQKQQQQPRLKQQQWLRQRWQQRLQQQHND